MDEEEFRRRKNLRPPLLPSPTDNTKDATYAYDHNGGQTLKSSATGNTVYHWDLRGRLVGLDTNADGQPDVTYAYNSDGVRISQSADGGTTFYLIDPYNPTGYAKAVEDRIDTNGDGTPDTAARTHLLGHQIIAQADTSGMYYLLLDGHGSTRALTDSAGQPAETYAYTAFGEAIGFDANTAKTNWLFAGDGIWDAKSPVIGTWRSKIPLLLVRIEDKLYVVSDTMGSSAEQLLSLPPGTALRIDRLVFQKTSETSHLWVEGSLSAGPYADRPVVVSAHFFLLDLPYVKVYRGSEKVRNTIWEVDPGILEKVP